MPLVLGASANQEAALSDSSITEAGHGGITHVRHKLKERTPNKQQIQVFTVENPCDIWNFLVAIANIF